MKSAASHGGAALSALLFGPVLAEFVQPGFPGIYRFFENLSLGISNIINSIFGIHTHPGTFISFFC